MQITELIGRHVQAPFPSFRFEHGHYDGMEQVFLALSNRQLPRVIEQLRIFLPKPLVFVELMVRHPQRRGDTDYDNRNRRRAQRKLRSATRLIYSFDRSSHIGILIAFSPGPQTGGDGASRANQPAVGGGAMRGLRSLGENRRPLFVFPNSTADGFAQGFPDAIDRNAVEYLLEETGDHHTRGFFAREAAALGVEDHFVVDAAGGRAVRAADVVGLDFQARESSRRGRDRKASGCRYAGSRRCAARGIDFDHPAPDDARLILQPSFVEQIAFAICRLMVLQRVIRKVLLAFGEYDAVHLHVGFRPGQRDVLIDFCQPAAQGADGPLQFRRRLRPVLFDGRSAKRRCPSFAGSRSATSRHGQR